MNSNLHVNTAGWLARAATLVLLAGLAGCSSNYIPQSRGRVSIVMMGGSPAYARDGQVIPHGFLGKGLKKAVRGNPAAEEAADEYYSRNRDGLLIGLGGLVCSVAAMGYVAHEATGDYHGEGDDGDYLLPALTAVGCLVASYAGIIYMASGAPYMYDAINLFNDRPPPCGIRAPGALSETSRAPCPGASATRPETALRME